MENSGNLGNLGNLSSIVKKKIIWLSHVEVYIDKYSDNC